MEESIAIVTIRDKIASIRAVKDETIKTINQLKDKLTTEEVTLLGLTKSEDELMRTLETLQNLESQTN